MGDNELKNTGVEDRYLEKAKPLSSIKPSNEIVRVITRIGINALDKSIQPKIDTNRTGKNASWMDGKDKNVGN